MAQVERCHICGRKMKAGFPCKVCKADAGETIRAEYTGVHYVNIMVHPLINIVLTNRRLLVFENMGGVGKTVGAQQGGLLGAGIGSVADKFVANSLGKNGSLKLEIALGDIQEITSADTNKEVRVSIQAAGQKKPAVFSLTDQSTGEIVTAQALAAKIRG